MEVLKVEPLGQSLMNGMLAAASHRPLRGWPLLSGTYYYRKSCGPHNRLTGKQMGNLFPTADRLTEIL